MAAVQRELGAKDLDRQIRRLTGVTGREQLEHAAELYRERLEESGPPLIGSKRPVCDDR